MNRQLLAYYDRYASWLPALASGVFAVLIGWALASLVWAVMPPNAAMQWTPPPLPKAAEDGKSANQRTDLGKLASAHLFGKYENKPQAVSREIMEAPETRLDLTLTGILAATENRGSRALIAQGKSDEEPYTIDDMVTRGVTLKSIFADRVILSRNGQLETLRLDKDSPSSFTPTPYVVAAPAEDANARTLSSQDAYKLAQIREELLANPAKASDYLRVQPARIGGQMRGYRIYPGRDRGIFSTAGLRPGDLVTSVNGVDLDDPAKALQLLGDLSQSENLSVTVERGGNQQTINVNLN